jgi:hypothetical protein
MDDLIMKGLIHQALEAQITLWDAYRAIEVHMDKGDMENSEYLLRGLAMYYDSPDQVTNDDVKDFIDRLRYER